MNNIYSCTGSPKSNSHFPVVHRLSKKNTNFINNISIWVKIIQNSVGIFIQVDSIFGSSSSWLTIGQIKNQTLIGVTLYPYIFSSPQYRMWRSCRMPRRRCSKSGRFAGSRTITSRSGRCSLEEKWIRWSQKIVSNYNFLGKFIWKQKTCFVL